MIAERLSEEDIEAVVRDLRAEQEQNDITLIEDEIALLQLHADLASAKAELAECKQLIGEIAAKSLDEALLEDLAETKAELAKAQRYMAMAGAGVEATIRERDQANDKLRAVRALPKKWNQSRLDFHVERAIADVREALGMGSGEGS